jgi:hypothetical protein
MATIYKTYDEITAAVIAEQNTTKIAFQKLTIEQRVYLVSRDLGVVNSKLYEALDKKQVTAISSKKVQGKFLYTFTQVTKATALFTSISTLLNNTLFGMYNTKTRYFILLETFKSLMSHANKSHLVLGILNNATATATATSVNVPSIGNASVSLSSNEIISILKGFTLPIYNKQLPDLTIIVESLLVSLLDVKLEREASIILKNFKSTSNTVTVLGDNLINKEEYLVASDIVVIIWPSKVGGNIVVIWPSKNSNVQSEVILYNDDASILAADNHLVEVDISKYESGSLRIYFGGTNIYNDTPTKGTLSFTSVSPGPSKHTSLVIQSGDFVGTIGNISIRKIT